MSTPLYIGMVAPYVVRVRVAAATGFDPVAAAAATAITVEVEKPNGTRESWPATVESESSSADAVTISHAFAAGDLDQRGAYACFAQFALANGQVLRSVVGRLPTVLDVNQVSP